MRFYVVEVNSSASGPGSRANQVTVRFHPQCPLQAASSQPLHQQAVYFSSSILDCSCQFVGMWTQVVAVNRIVMAMTAGLLEERTGLENT